MSSSSSAPSSAAAVPAPRLVLYTGASDYKLLKIFDEYSIEALEGTAFAVSPDNEWYAVALEIGGKRLPFAKSEHVTIRVTDERDPVEGTHQLWATTSTAPWQGRHALLPRHRLAAGG